MRRRRPNHSRVARDLYLSLSRGQSGMARIRAHRRYGGQRLYRATGHASSARHGGIGVTMVSALACADDEVGRWRASATMLARTPLKTIMSGPVAGVIGARHLGDVKGIENLISFDAGGTSSDMAVLPGAPLFRSELTIARHPLRTHAIDFEPSARAAAVLPRSSWAASQGWSSQRRCRARAGMLCARRHRADAERCARAPGPSQSHCAA